MTYKYRFYITHNSVETEVYPLKFPDSKFAWEKESDQVFRRKKFNGSLVFGNLPADGITDYTLLKGIEDGANRCLEVSLRIDRSCNDGTTYNTYWNGYFSVNDGDWDLDNCKVTFKDIKPDDVYRCLIEKSEQEVNILEIENEVTATATLVTAYEFFTCRDTNIDCVLAGLPSPGEWLLFHTEVVDGVTTSIYYREAQITACIAGVAQAPPGSGWVQDTGYGDCVNGLSRWVREPQTVYTNNPNPNVSPGDCEDDGSGGYIEVLPPRKKTLDVTRTNTPTTPPIEGYDEALRTSGNYTFSVRNNPGSTYTWSVSAGTIMSGQGTNQVEIEFNTVGAAITVQVIETSICATNAAVTKSVDVQLPGSTVNIPADVQGPELVCKNQTGVIFRVPVLPENFTDNITWTLIPVTPGSPLVGFSIVSGQGTNEIVVDFGESHSEIMVQFSADDTTSGPPGVTHHIDGSLNVTINNSVRTPDVVGIDSVCPNSTGIVYEIPDRPGATYNWTVSGGTITAGQGTNAITVSWNNSTGSGSVTVKETVNCGCTWQLISDCGASGEPSFYWCVDITESGIEYTHNRTLEDILDYFIDQLGCDLDGTTSDFFEINPVGDASGYVAGDNYVTGEANEVDHILFAQKSDIIDPTASNPATKGIMTFNSLMNILRVSYNVFWFIENSKLRIEHLSFFQQTLGVDTTTDGYSKYVSGKTKYSYNKAKMPKYERWKWSEASDLDFVGAEIFYGSICVNQDEKSNVANYTPGDVTTDISYINSFPDDIAKTGFVMLACQYIGGEYAVRVDVGKISNLPKANAAISWANLHYNYHRHGRVLMEGKMNLEDTNFLSVAKNKKQVEFKIPMCCGDELNPLTDFVQTALGEGEIEKMELSVKSNMVTLELIYE